MSVADGEWSYPAFHPMTDDALERVALRIVDALDGAYPNDADRALQRAKVLLGWQNTVDATAIRAIHPLGAEQ